MINKDKLFKKDNGQWKYYPFGHVIDDVYLTVKEGRKDDFCQALDDEWKWVYALILPTIGLGLYNPLLIPVPFLFYAPYFFINRSRIEKKYCEYKSYSKIKFFTAYRRIFYFFIDETDSHQLRVFFLGFILMLISAVATYIDGGHIGWVVTMMFFSLLFLTLFIIISVKRFH